jgi:hypothetical protein
MLGKVDEHGILIDTQFLLDLHLDVLRLWLVGDGIVTRACHQTQRLASAPHRRRLPGGSVHFLLLDNPFLFLALGRLVLGPAVREPRVLAQRLSLSLRRRCIWLYV